MALIKRKKKSENISDLIKLVKDDETYKGRDGKDGITPDEPYLISLIKPLIPKVRNGFDGKDGENPTPEYLSSLISPLIPKVKDGETPDNKRLIELIKPLLPKMEPMQAISTEDVIDEIKSKDEVFNMSNIKGIHEYIDRRIPLNMTGSPRIKMFNSESEMPTPLGSLNIAGTGFTLTNIGQDYTLNITGGGGTWGSITGTLSNQTDLQTALDAKQNVITITSVADATSITPNSDTSREVTQINTQATGTLTINAPTGTPIAGQALIFRIKSTNVQTFAWNAIYRMSNGGSLPAITAGGGYTNYYCFMYNFTDTKWDLTGTI